MAAGILGTIAASSYVREYAQGASQKGASALSEFLAPTVNVPTLTGTYTKYDEKQRFRIIDTRRAPHQNATRVTLSGKQLTYVLEPHALDVPVDIIEQMTLEGQSGGLYANGMQVGGNAAALNTIAQNLFVEAADLAVEKAWLSHENRVLGLAVDNAGDGGSLAPSGGVWDDAADPVLDIDTIIRAVRLAAPGLNIEVGILFGYGAETIFRNQKNVKNRIIIAPGAAPAGGVGVNALDIAGYGALFQGKPATQSTAIVRDANPEGAEVSNEFLLDNSIIVFARARTPNRHDASAIKTLRPTGAWMVPGTYLSQDQRQQVAKMDWFESPFVGNAAAIYKLDVTTSDSIKDKDASQEGKARAKAAKKD